MSGKRRRVVGKARQKPSHTFLLITYPVNLKTLFKRSTWGQFIQGLNENIKSMCKHEKPARKFVRNKSKCK